MQLGTEELCSICQQYITKVSFLFYSCNHKFCMKCYPFIMIYFLKSGIQREFFENKTKQYSCPLCSVGKCEFPVENQKVRSQGNSESKNQKLKICSKCHELKANNFCIDCQKEFCEECLDLTHAKKFEKHKLKNVDCIEEEKSVVFNCTCPAKRYLSHFCLKCKIALCAVCLKNSHEGHEPQIPIEELLLKFENINQGTLKKKIKILMENYANFKEVFLENLDASRRSFNSQFKTKIKSITAKLRSIRREVEEKSFMEMEFLREQMELIQTSFKLINKELIFEASFSNMHPNQKFHLMKLLEDISVEKIEYNPTNFLMMNFDDAMQNIKNIETKIQEMLNQNYTQQNYQLLKIFGQPELFKTEKIQKTLDLYNFKSDPTKLLEKEPDLIEEKCFNFGYYKSGLSCSFLNNEESFLAWTGYSIDAGGKKTFPLVVYNISKNKKEITLQNENEYLITSISIISVFDKKWLYCSDKKGILRIYEIASGFKEKENIFQLKSSIKTKNIISETKSITSAKIFQDKFKEIENTNDFYAMIAFEDISLPLLLYKYDSNIIEEEKWILSRKISKPFVKCCTMNFYHDDNAFKTRFFLGFSGSSISIYDLKKNSPQLEPTEMKTTDDVLSINFHFWKEPFFFPESDPPVFVDRESDPVFVDKSSLIYTQQNNELIIVDVETLQIAKKVKLNQARYIYDCCIWNDFADKNMKGKILLAIYGYSTNYVITLDFETLDVLKSKDFKKYPVNLTKLLKKKNNKTNGESFKEGLAIFFEYGDKSNLSWCFNK